MFFSKNLYLYYYTTQNDENLFYMYAFSGVAGDVSIVVGQRCKELLVLNMALWHCTSFSGGNTAELMMQE